MAVLPDAVEIWDYVPENPSNAAVLDDRWIVVADQYADEFMIFDAQNEISRAYDGIGSGGAVTSNAYRHLVAADGYVWCLGVGSTGWVVNRIESDGSVTKSASLQAVGSTYYNRSSFAYEDGVLWCNIWITSSSTYGGLYTIDTTTLATTGIFSRVSSTLFAANGVVALGPLRWDAATATPLTAGANLGASRYPTPSRDGVSHGVTGSTVYRITLAGFTGSSAGIALGAPAHGPNDLVYVPGIGSPYTYLYVEDSTGLTHAIWDFPIARTGRAAVAYAQGKMWAFAREDPTI